MSLITGGTYELDAEQIQLNAYRLGCLFFANKEIARRSDPSAPNPIAGLEQKFFAREMSHLLLQIAIAASRNGRPAARTSRVRRFAN
jgi:hypothetical protein